MGAAASVNTFNLLTAEELGTKIASLGAEYEVYKAAFVEKDLTGEKVSTLTKDEQIATLKEIGVGDAHLETLIAAFEQLNTVPAVPEAATGEPAEAKAEEATSTEETKAEGASTEESKTEGASTEESKAEPPAEAVASDAEAPAEPAPVVEAEVAEPVLVS